MVLARFHLKKNQTRVAQQNLKKRIAIEIENIQNWSIGLGDKQIYEDIFKTLGDQCYSYANGKHWIARFYVDRVNIGAVGNMISSDHRSGLKWTSKAFNISCERIDFIVYIDLNRRQISAKWIHKYLNIVHKLAKIDVSRTILARFEKGADYLNHVVTMGETWVPFYDSETKQQSME